MINPHSLVIYKNKPAIVREKTDGKFSIDLADGSNIKVRDKDIEMLYPGPVKDFSFLEGSPLNMDAVREAWELLSEEDSAYTLKDLASFIFGEYTAVSAYGAYKILQDGLFFTFGKDIADTVVLRSKGDIEAEEAKRNDKQRDAGERLLFLERVKSCLKNKGSDASSALFESSDIRFLQDVEALALGKSAKSRTMKELGLGETPQEAHLLLLKTGVWNIARNPYPCRYGISLSNAPFCPDSPPAEDRLDLRRLDSYAIDSPWSSDPDDALSYEKDEDSGKALLYVHIADPAASVFPGSPAEIEARNRGATVYLPEGAVRMLAEDSLPMFALGLSEKSFALTFKITLDENAAVIETAIFPSVIKVRRITYEQADKILETEASSPLCAVYALAMKYLKKRLEQGAVLIELPEAHLSVKDGKPDIEPVASYRSVSMVRECMIMAGEAAGAWAAGKALSFPYLGQEVELQGKVPGGYAGSYQLRRCMRPRVLSARPLRHQGLGLDTYTQVTSPLRRYNDLLAHMQIRSFLRGEKTLGNDDVSSRLGFCEAAISAATQAERASILHWTLVFLSDKKDSVWEAVALEKKGKFWALVIPSLALETPAVLNKDIAPNENVRLVLKSVNIPRLEAVFVQE